VKDGIAALQTELMEGGNITAGQCATVRDYAEARGVPEARRLFSKACVLEPKPALEQLRHLTERLITEGVPRDVAGLRAIERWPALALQAHRADLKQTVAQYGDDGRETSEWKAANQKANDAYARLRELADARAEKKLKESPAIYRNRHEAFTVAMEEVQRENASLTETALGRERWQTS